MTDKGVAIYHVVKPNEDFDTAAKSIYQLVVEAQAKEPNQDRYLYIDIEGHRNKNGGLDHDMYELLTHFTLGFLGQYVKKIQSPMYSYNNPHDQNNQLPGEVLEIRRAA